MQSRILLTVSLALGLAACSQPKSPSVTVTAIDALKAVSPHLEASSLKEAEEILASEEVAEVDIEIRENEDKNMFEIEIEGIKAAVELVDSEEVAIRVNGYDISRELFQNESEFKRVLMQLLVTEESASLSNLVLPKAHAFFGGGMFSSLLGLVLRGAVNYLLDNTKIGRAIGGTVRPIIDGVIDGISGGSGSGSGQVGILPVPGQGGQNPTSSINGVFGRLMDLFGGLFGRR